jgi:preprotein translocase subunit SecE
MAQRSATAKRTSPRLVRFVSDTIAELKKVIWLSRRELAYLTGLVLLVSIVAGVVFGIIDYGFTQFVNRVLLGG